MPLYDAANGCYRFYKYRAVLQSKTDANDASKIVYGVGLLLNNPEGYDLIAGGETGISFEISLSWSGMNVNHTFSEDIVKTFGEKAYEQTNAGGSLRTAMTVTVVGLDKLASGTTLSATVTVKTQAKTEKTTNTVTYTVSTVE